VLSPEKTACFDIADIVRSHREQLESSQVLSLAQKRVLTDIANCRTAALGGHIDRCIDCGYEQPSYNSCRNRHCPKCQALTQEAWIAKHQARLLDVEHFHVVFTLPAELRSLARFAPHVVYNALVQTAGRTLLEFGQSRLAATIGATLVLHTWTRELLFHPHVHALVTGGGLSPDGTHWRPARRKFLFPVKAMSRVFFGKMVDVLRDEYDRGHFAGFDDFRDPEGFSRLLRSIAKRSWNVYAKPTLSKGEHVLEYLGRYTHRVGLSNSRLLEVTRYCIRFRTKGDAIEALDPLELLRRFVQHVLPSGFHKIRHIGLNASNAKRTQARACLHLAAPIPKIQSWQQRLLELTGRDISRCPLCGGWILPFPLSCARDPPESLAA
jgi:predicted Zn-ribbon and HTH transcriptional regulator